MNDLFTDISWRSLQKHGEYLCGDQVVMAEGSDGNKILVLADGLGSGVKACILSTLTSRILSTMLAGGVGIDDCISAVAATLPVCRLRGIAYSTFTVLRLRNNLDLEIIEYENPQVILLREGKNLDLSLKRMEIQGKSISYSRLGLRENDLLVAVSDGAVHAGAGSVMNMNWQRGEIIAFLEERCAGDLPSGIVSFLLLDECNALYAGKPGDDVTVCALRIRRRNPVNLLIGPPLNPAEDHRMLALFFSKSGRHIVCGGSSAAMAADFLHKPLRSVPASPDPAVPPISSLEGVDLVTEGLVTIGKVTEYARKCLVCGLGLPLSGSDERIAPRFFDWRDKEDGAARIFRLLFEEATDVNFYVGRAVNPAYLRRDAAVESGLKLRLVAELADCLKKMGKQVKLSYF